MKSTRVRKLTTGVQAGGSPSRREQFHAVSVKCGSGACDGARALGARRYLSSEAPRLPLESCNAMRCDCRYVHYADRRDADADSVKVPQGFGQVAADSQPADRRDAVSLATREDGIHNGWLFLAR